MRHNNHRYRRRERASGWHINKVDRKDFPLGAMAKTNAHYHNWTRSKTQYAGRVYGYDGETIKIYSFAKNGRKTYHSLHQSFLEIIEPPLTEQPHLKLVCSCGCELHPITLEPIKHASDKCCHKAKSKSLNMTRGTYK